MERVEDGKLGEAGAQALPQRIVDRAFGMQRVAQAQQVAILGRPARIVGAAVNQGVDLRGIQARLGAEGRHVNAPLVFRSAQGVAMESKA